MVISVFPKLLTVDALRCFSGTISGGFFVVCTSTVISLDFEFLLDRSLVSLPSFRSSTDLFLVGDEF